MPLARIGKERLLKRKADRLIHLDKFNMTIKPAFEIASFVHKKRACKLGSSLSRKTD